MAASELRVSTSRRYHHPVQGQIRASEKFPRLYASVSTASNVKLPDIYRGTERKETFQQGQTVQYRFCRGVEAIGLPLFHISRRGSHTAEPVQHIRLHRSAQAHDRLHRRVRLQTALRQYNRWCRCHP